jgi:hypothetical protein
VPSLATAPWWKRWKFKDMIDRVKMNIYLCLTEDKSHNEAKIGE